MESTLQKVVGEHKIAKENAQQLIKAYGAPFTEVGKLLSDYTFDEEGVLVPTDNSIIVKDETDKKSMLEARELRLKFKKFRTGIETTRVDLKADSLRTSKAIDGVAKYIKSHIEPVENYLEKQEKFAEIKEAERLLALKTARIEKIKPFCENPYTYDTLDVMTDAEFDKLFAELKAAFELKKAQEEAYQREQQRIAAEKEAEDKRIRDENEVLRKQAEVREAEIAKEREDQEVIRQAELAAVREKAKNTTADKVKAALDILPQFKSEDINGGKPMVDYQSVINLFIKK